MSENIKNTAAESAQNAAGAAEAVTHDMTAEAVNEPVQADAGVYTHTFKKPFEYAGETYTTLTAYAAPTVQPDRRRWCIVTAGMVHGDRRCGAPGRHAENYSGMPLRLRMDSPSIWMV